MNKVSLMGRLTATPELKQTQSGNSVVSFCVAVDRRFQGQDGKRETDFINCVAWKKTAEFIAKYFGKGRMVAINGAIQTRKYTDRDGKDRMATEVIADEVYFCGDKQADSVQPISGGQNTIPEGFEECNDGDDLPF